MLAISSTGNETLEDAHNYCGNGSFSAISQANTLTIGLFSTLTSPGGQFRCIMTAVKDSPEELGGPALQNQLECDCGWRISPRIVGGHEPRINEFPWMAGIIDLRIRMLWCGANIISEFFVLTAAHCIDQKPPDMLAVLTGEHNLTTGNDTPATAIYLVSTYVIHPDYEDTYYTGDIAIVQTKTQILFSFYVGPICLPFQYTNYNFVGEVVTILGWGSMEYFGPTSDVILETLVTIVSNEQCAQQFGMIIDKQICTYGEKRDACYRDSGGPLLWAHANSARLHLIGIISQGRLCGGDIPSVNTKVTPYLSWIVSTTGVTFCSR
ncbi:venom serine protease 34-like [Cylas formicarius]|uniref:venom serine protease 34-like n=1 Tax=Cylas formicarius TaxID=197179 RepID=UPI002958DC7A|nr:venom serine protease 34-like [Cylas formicarius]